jgi:hypothetical protein
LFDTDASGGWLGENCGFTHLVSPSTNHLLLGWEGGIGLHPYGRELFVGLGPQFLHTDAWHFALNLRLGLGDPDDFKMAHVQAGPMLLRGKLGVSGQVGYDWTFAALYFQIAGAPNSSVAGNEVEVTVGARLSLEAVVVGTAMVIDDLFNDED